MGRKGIAIAVVMIVVALLLVGIVSSILSEPKQPTIPPRIDTIPSTAVKQTPQGDLYPPILRSDEWESPVPMPGPVNTAGAEDSPFITPDGKRFFFFFTPDLNIPIQKQLGDKVTGIWWTQNISGQWTEPQRIVLGTLQSLDGDEFAVGDTLWFGSVRVGNLGEIDIYNSTLESGEWKDVKNAGQQLNVEYDIGAFCFTPDGTALYYGKGGDIWKCVKSQSGWGPPQKVPNLDGVTGKDQPFVTPAGDELWFTGNSIRGSPGPALFRCNLTQGGGWGSPQEIVSRFAGEPTLDSQGNLYFVHHYVTQNISLIEADIYVAMRKSGGSVSAAPGGTRADLVLGAALAAPCLVPLIATIRPTGRERYRSGAWERQYPFQSPHPCGGVFEYKWLAK